MEQKLHLKIAGKSFNSGSMVFKTTVILSLLLISGNILAGTGTWTSNATGGSINYTSTEAATPQKDNSGNYMTVVYLENMAFDKFGKNSNATDVAWLLEQGYRVIELDYSKHANAKSPNINADIISINDAINSGSFCGFSNCSKYRSYVLFEGYRIARDVSYFKDDPTVYNYPTTYTVGDSMYMDIVYPANTETKVPVVLSFSYSNSWAGAANKHQRLFLGYTLAMFDDSFLEGAPARGMAWAIADHPKYCDWGQGKPAGGANKAYGAYETNPDAARKVKSAIRTLRVKGESLNLSGKIGIYGFSRGSTAGSMAVGDKSVSNFEDAGLYIGTNDDVQVAALGSGVFDYTLIFNTEESDVGNLRTNCPLGWGALDSNRALWETQGSSYLVETSASAPVIFFYNTSDNLYYQDQIAKFKAKLDGLGVPTATVTNYGTGHAVPTTATPLTTVYLFMQTYLNSPSVYTGVNSVQTNKNISLKISPNPVTDVLNLQFSVVKEENIKITLYNVSGSVIFKSEKRFSVNGNQHETIQLSNFSMPQGLYYVKIESENNNGIVAFAKK